MLTADPTRRSARIDVSSTVVRLALLYVAHDSGWDECPDDEACCGCITVSDRVPAQPGRVDILVVRDEPAACQDGLRAALDGRVGAIVLWNAPEDLRPACDGIEAGLTVIPRRVIDLGAMAPRLTQRQRETLKLLARGTSSHGIAGALRQSESTAKRDIAELLHVFDVPNRTALVSSAASLGFVRPPV